MEFEYSVDGSGPWGCSDELNPQLEVVPETTAHSSILQNRAAPGYPAGTTCEDE